MAWTWSTCDSPSEWLAIDHLETPMREVMEAIFGNGALDAYFCLYYYVR